MIDKTDAVGLIVLSFLCGIAAMLGIVWCSATPNHIWRAEAIEHGAAEYVCDPQTGKTEFRWKEKK